MSFGFNNINGPRPKPTIIEAQNMQNNGGGGNLGYFEQQRKKSKDNELEDEDIFIKEDDSGDKESIFDKILKIFKKK
jgi:hypothetical protein